MGYGNDVSDDTGIDASQTTVAPCSSALRQRELAFPKVRFRCTVVVFVALSTETLAGNGE